MAVNMHIASTTEPVHMSIANTGAVDGSGLPSADLSNYYTKAQTDERDTNTLESAQAYADKQVPAEVDTYVSAHRAELKGDKGDTGAPGKDGKDGAQGVAGVPGADGAPGATGKDGAPGKDGTNGKDGAQGAAGNDGADGASAYQIARAHGYGGTEAQWLASLKGADGATGATGKTGATGAPGAQGEPGAAGADGYSPVRGVDYWTAADIAEIQGYVDAAILGGAW